MALQTDSLVKGCGASAMAFVDVMPKDTDATFTMVDKRAAPGGHWNDACHGVASRALGHGRKDSTEFNQGLLELASGCEVTDYFHQWMRDTCLPSGRVRFMPMSPVPGGPGTGRHAVRSLLSGPEELVQVRRRLVDDTLLHTSIPLTHTRKFSVADGVACVPPNDLARLAPGHTSFSVLGAGKTAIDSVSWLLANGAPPDSISWVLPREPWLLNRLVMQPGLDFFDQAIGAVARQLETFASAGSVHELCERMEEAGTWLRLDPTVWPTMFHGATVTSLELRQLRGIKNRVRLGRVLHLAADRMVLERGQVPARPGTLFVDCTARALQVLPPGGVLPTVFDDGVVRLHVQDLPADLQRRAHRPCRGLRDRRRGEAAVVSAGADGRHRRGLLARDGHQHAQPGSLGRRSRAACVDPLVPAGHVRPDHGAGGRGRRPAARRAGPHGGSRRPCRAEPAAADRRAALTELQRLQQPPPRQPGDTVPTYRSFTQHLDPNVGPKRILALDGGGLRGVLTLGMLREIETVLRERHADPDLKLCDYFDLIAGTSTGAIIAAALSLGMSVDDVHRHYLALGNVVFKRSLLRWGVLRAKFDADKVKQALIGVLGERRMDSPDFRTGLLVVTKRLDTGSCWPVTNNPGAKYFKGGTQATTIPNADYPLWQVVRASTAAPYFFDPETIRIGRGAGGLKGVSGDFVDGGVSPSNNPSLQALMTATMDGYRLRWPAGDEQLLVVSVGTGKADPEVGHANVLEATSALHAVLSLKALMEDCADQVESVMQWLSSSPTARRIDREMEQAQPTLGGRAMCSYLRYIVLLQKAWCADNLGETFSAKALKALEAMDEPDNIPELDRVGRLAGNKLVKAEHFTAGFDAKAG